MGMLLRRRNATDSKKVTKAENVTPVAEKKAIKKADEKKSDK